VGFFHNIYGFVMCCVDMRKPYNGIDDQFDVKDLISKEPFGNFQHWLDQACNCSSIYEPNAMSIATATALVLFTIVLSVSKCS